MARKSLFYPDSLQGKINPPTMKAEIFTMHNGGKLVVSIFILVRR
jgi:hypothetical protein